MAEQPEASLQDVAASGMDGRAVGLVGDLLLASQRGIQATTDRLWEGERRRRMVLEARIEQFLAAADTAHQGTVREYEYAIDLLRYPMSEEKLLRQHPEFDEKEDS